MKNGGLSMISESGQAHSLPNLPSVSIDPRYLVTREVVERPPAERPMHDNLDGIADWLVEGALQIASAAQVFDEFAWRMLATGLPMLRVTLHSRTLHPQFLGVTFVWWRTTGQTVQTMIAHEVADVIRNEDNPVWRVSVTGETLRRRLDVAEDQLDFPILRDLKASGGVDYLALPIRSAHGGNYMVTYVTDQVGGFRLSQLADLTRLSRRLSVVADMHTQRWIARNLLSAYVGSKAGPRVLAGQIRRGTGEELTVVLWSSDLRGFTARSDRLAGDRMIAILNALFEAQAKAIRDHGGEILKFVGDGLLAIFPIDDVSLADEPARNALAAASEALRAVRDLADDPSMVDQPPLEIVVALHIGTVIYGNIGAADRLDFTVIGPAVNLVNRIEAVAKVLNLPIVVSDEFARIYGESLKSLGNHQLRGLSTMHELFAPAAPLWGSIRTQVPEGTL
jgi:adenylate cyclase